MTIALVGFGTEPGPIGGSDLGFNNRSNIGVPHRETRATSSSIRHRITTRTIYECEKRSVVSFVLRPAAVLIGFVGIGVEEKVGRPPLRMRLHPGRAHLALVAGS